MSCGLRSSLACCALALLCLLAPLRVQAQTAQGPARVFVVQSYNAEYEWTQHINEGIRDGLRGLKVSFDYFYLDAKRKTDPENLRQAATAVLEQIEARAPQLVITVDDAAQLYLAAPLLKGRASPQVIFCGVNAPPSRYGFPAANISGVRERWHFREGFALMKKISPSARSVAVLVDDSESGGYVLDELRQELRQGGPFALKLAGAEHIRSFQEWQRKVLAYQGKADILALGLYHSLVDEGTGSVVPPETVSAWNNAHNKRPSLGFTDFALSHGHLAGVLESGHEQGFLAGSMARQVLEKGVRAGSLPVRINQKGIVMLNLKTAERLGLAIPFELIEAAGRVVK